MTRRSEPAGHGPLSLAVAVFFVISASALAASALDYGVFVEAETEEDLLDLYTSDQIDEVSFQTLRDLLIDGVKIARAKRDELYLLPNLSYADVDRIVAYRKEVGRLHDPADLVAASVLSREKLAAIAPFLIVGKSGGKVRGSSGKVKYETTYVRGDDQIPSMALVGSFKTGAFEFGLSGLLTRTRISGVEYDPARQALRANDRAVAAHVPKYFAEYDTPKLHLIAGTYRLGFGQRLTFDNSSSYTPNGIQSDNNIYYGQSLTGICNESKGELSESPCAGVKGDQYMSPDYRWSDRLRGIAVGLPKIEMGSGWMQVYAFGSYESHSLYQYELYNRDKCDDPLDDKSDNCKAPPVYKKLDDPDEATSKYAYETLPNIYNDAVFGGNVSYFSDRRTHVGLTGYHAIVSWPIEGDDLKLDFQEWSRLPYGGPFSALGIDGALGSGAWDVFAEVTRSVDSQPAGGGWGALLRSTWSIKHHEVEAVARYYDRDFANPFARPIAAADEYDGLRARDEAGLRLKYTGTLGKLRLRATADQWVRKRALATDGGDLQEKSVLAVLARLRLSYDLTRWLRPALSFDYGDKDISDSSRQNCYSVISGTLVAGEPTYCQGEKYQAAAQISVRPRSNLSLSARYQHRFVDDTKPKFDNSFRQDRSMWFLAVYRPLPNLRLRGRASYLFEDITDKSYLDEIFAAYGEAAYLIHKSWWMKLRYQYYEALDDRSSTQARTPNPSHWVRLELEARF